MTWSRFAPGGGHGFHRAGIDVLDLFGVQLGQRGHRVDGQRDHAGKGAQPHPDDDDQTPDDRIDGAHDVEEGAHDVINRRAARETRT